MNPRTCIVTRQEHTPDQMIRFVCDPQDVVVPDIRRKLDGRGVWISPSQNLLMQAIKKGLFSRGFKKQVKVDENLVKLVEALLKRQCLDYLALARKSGFLNTGQAKVDALIREEKIAAIVHSAEAAEDGKSKIAQAIRMSERQAIPIYSMFSGAELDQATGMGNVTHIGISNGNLAETLISTMNKLSAYMEV